MKTKVWGIDLLEKWFVQGWRGSEGRETGSQEQPCPGISLVILVAPGDVCQLSQDLIPESWPALAFLYDVIPQYDLVLTTKARIANKPKNLKQNEWNWIWNFSTVTQKVNCNFMCNVIL